MAFKFVITLLISLSLYIGSANAALSVRWTDKDDANAEFDHVVQVLNAKTGAGYTAADFKLWEASRLSTSLFETYVQMAGGLPLKNRNLRIWKNPETGRTLQVEALLEDKTVATLWVASRQKAGMGPTQLTSRLSSRQTMDLIRARVKAHPDDRLMQKVEWKDYWSDGNILRFVTVKSKHGTHKIQIDVESRKITGATYEEFPQADIPVKVYPIYEQADNSENIQSRVSSVLKNLSDTIVKTDSDPFAVLRTKRYPEGMYDPILGLIPAFQEQGYWSPVDLKNKAAAIISTLPRVPNDFEHGLYLAGKFVTVNIHPDAKIKFTGINFDMKPSAQYKPLWLETATGFEYVPGASVLGRPALSAEELYNRVPQRLANHDPATYINDGYDEVQVYWAVDTLMTSLHEMGFADPGLSTRPFNAFLYDPDIAYRDNAYYTDDTINFTTYSPAAQNFARDNSTIWHELGHGVMDRLMGDYITLADTGGLSEGMADFVAQLVVQKVSGGVAFEGSDAFRIMNQTGFNLTNEVHDDGEAYGGAMNDLLVKAIAKYGREGLVKVSDLTMEAMRLTRNHPQLTAQEWFNHMMYADENDSQYRKAGELRDILVSGLEGRNYRFDEKSPASLTLLNNGSEVTDRTPGSRGAPILYTTTADSLITHHMTVKLQSTDTYKFVYPVKVRVQFEGGPLQGAINWVGQESKYVDYVLNSESEAKEFDLVAKGNCESINREDGSCVDFAYVQIWNAGETKKPVAKKRFYLRIKTQP